MSGEKGISFNRQVFEELYGNPDMENGVNKAIELIGRKFNISRVYIFENSDDNLFADNTFEWCADGIEPQIDVLQHMSYEEYDYAAAFHETGMFFCPDVSTLPDMQRELFESQNIKAVLQYAIYERGVFRGFVGYDDCVSIRPDWKDNGQELDTLSFLSKLLTVYLLKERNLRRSERYHNELIDALMEARVASAAKGVFMSRMSHEIRTPLNAIIGYNAIAVNDITEAKTDSEYRQAMMKVADCLSKSNIASRHLLTIINDVLDMTAIESGKIKINRERFDFRGLINTLTTIFYAQAKNKGVEFEVIFNSMTEEWFIGDQMRTNQILTNLLSNAIKFTPDGGRVTLAIWQPEGKENAAHIHFEVKDSGIGMAPEFLKKIWKPFEQENASIGRRFGGSGLGLSITKNLVDLMGGTIEVESEQDKGSNFKVDLTFERTEQPSNSGSYDFSVVNALVVDDDQSTCDYIHLLMGRFGARSYTVTSGQAAVEAVVAAEQKNDPFTVCLIDWRMPGMDGLETAKRINEVVDKSIPIIVITAYDFSEIVDKVSEVGITKFLSKPLFQSSLFDLLANICGIQSEKKTQKAAAPSFTGSRVLLVEDNTMNMEIARRILQSTGLEVESAWNGQKALEIFESSPVGTYQAILMDIQMPVMDGHEAAQAIRASEHQEAQSIPIIAMTADAFAENVEEALASGMNDHIAKPIDLPTLFEVLGKYIQ